MPLLPSVYSYLLDVELNWRDMMLDAPKVYTSYMQMLAMPPDEVEFLMMVGVIVHDYGLNAYRYVSCSWTDLQVADGTKYGIGHDC